MPLPSLETPCAVVDLDRMAANLDRMAAYCAAHKLALRPHVKTHKSPRIAAEQLRRGAAGLTCATPRELEIMGDLGDDLLLAYPLVGAAKLRRVMSLPGRIRLTVALDSVAALEPLAEAARAADREVGVYVEIDVGMHRVGVPAAGDAITIARRVRELAPLVYRGIAFYPGHIRDRVGEQGDKLERLSRDLRGFLESLDKAGLAPDVVSGGSTPMAQRMHEVAGVTEVRPGTYVYNDRATAELEACTWEQCAFSVLATVVSTSVSGQAVVDAGTKALGREPLPGGESLGFAALLDQPDVVVTRMSEEHGILDLSRSTWRPGVGDQVRLVPNHVCVVVHLNDQVVGVRGDKVETSWPVSARGRGGAPEAAA